MTRTHASAKAAGRDLENVVSAFLGTRLADDRIERRRQGGMNDRGEIAGVRMIGGGRVVIECKNYSSDRIQISKWLAETEVERGNDDARIGVLVVKVRGNANPADQLVCMTLETFATMLEGGAQ